MTTSSEILSAKQLQAFNDDGYLVLPNFVDAAACLELRERALQLAQDNVPLSSTSVPRGASSGTSPSVGYGS